MTKNSTSSQPKPARVLHRNVRPQWYGVVLAKHMQDPAITSELKALIAVVSTYPRENWTWRAKYLRSMLNWGEERWQRVMREAKDHGFVTVTKVSDGKSIKSEYQWNIDTPKAAPRAKSVRKPENPTHGKTVQRATRAHNDVVRSNEEVKSNDKDKPLSLSGAQPKNAARGLTPIPEDFKFKTKLIELTDYVAEHFETPPSERYVRRVLNKFIDHCLSKDKRSADWKSEFLLYLRRGYQNGWDTRDEEPQEEEIPEAAGF